MDRAEIEKRRDEARVKFEVLARKADDAGKELLICVSAFGRKPTAEERGYERDRRSRYITAATAAQDAFREFKKVEAAAA
jgi:hypothetical protein